MDLTWFEAKEKYPEAIELLLGSEEELNEAEVAFKSELSIDEQDGLLVCSERFVPCEPIVWKPEVGWVMFEADEHGVDIDRVVIPRET